MECTSNTHIGIAIPTTRNLDHVCVVTVRKTVHGAGHSTYRGHEDGNIKQD